MKFEVLRNFVKNYKLEESRNFHHSTLFSSNPFLNQHKLNIYENIIVNIIKLNVDKKTFILCLKKLNTAIQIIFHFNLNSNIQPYTPLRPAECGDYPFKNYAKLSEKLTSYFVCATWSPPVVTPLRPVTATTASLAKWLSARL